MVPYDFMLQLKAKSYIYRCVAVQKSTSTFFLFPPSLVVSVSILLFFCWTYLVSSPKYYGWLCNTCGAAILLLVRCRLSFVLISALIHVGSCIYWISKKEIIVQSTRHCSHFYMALHKWKVWLAYEVTHWCCRLRMESHVQYLTRFCSPCLWVCCCTPRSRQ